MKSISNAERLFHAWAWLLACATFPLIWVGGLVTSTGAGMAFKDWLTSDGHFMLFYPWLASTGDKFVEHGHRLLGALVGFLAIGLVALAWKFEPRSWVRKYSVLILVAVIAQGILGGLRVVLDERTLALVHGCTGPLFFALCAAMLPITSRWWRESEPLPPTAGANKLQQAAVFVVLLSYGQIVLGALVRHAPHLTSPLAPTLFQLAVYFHLLVAGGLLVQVLSLGWQSSKLRQRRGGAAALALLVLIQIALGATSWVVKYGIPSWLANLWGDLSFVNTAEGSLPTVIVTSHVAVGSLILATALVIALRQARQLRVGPPRLFLTTLSNREVVL